MTADPAAPEQHDAAANGGPPADKAQATPPQAPAASCARCGAPLAAGQDWCLQCGAGAPGSLGSGQGWRPAAWILGLVALLVLGAAAAGYAALSKGPRKPQVTTRTVAVSTPPAVATVTPPPTTPPITLPPAAKTALPPVSSKVPRIPLPTTTPKVTTPPAKTTPAKTTPLPTANANGGGEETHSNALVLDTNAASTYNPYALPVGDFGDPSLAIDGDDSTGWTALVEASTAPRMAAGLVLDLKSAQRLSALKLVTTSPGMTIQVYGAASASAPPASITDPAWVKLTHATVVRKRHQRFVLQHAATAFRYVVVWISSAPAAAKRVTLNELELFPFL